MRSSEPSAPVGGSELEAVRQRIERWRQTHKLRTRIPDDLWASAVEHLVIDEAQADVVRTLFTWHAEEGMTIRQIAKRLTREGYPTPKGGPQWGETTVHRILRRDAYLGTLHYNQSVWSSVPVTGSGSVRQKKGLRPSSEWIAISIPPLIDRERFEHSQARHGPNQQFSPRNLREERWLLRRLVRCEKCGLKCVCVAPSHLSRSTVAASRSA